jgi:multisubunit Na+/H+ antiporter MnhE subunit
MEISRENVRWNYGLTRSNFREFIGGFIISACNVVVLEAVKLVLKASYLLTVGFHLGIMAVRALHDLVDHELGVTTNVEVSDP